MVASTCETFDDGDDSLSTMLLIFEGSSCENLNCVAGNNEYCGNLARVVWQSEPEATYFIYVYATDHLHFNLTVEEISAGIGT